ncbi:MAG TPA: UDP-4-amino-4,6-dideoxy-N-acetyl-beta-L-altrosamine transaminase [Polyangia bacterium]
MSFNSPARPIPYGRQSITDEDVEAVVATLRSDFLTQGPKVAEFERAFCDYTGARYAVAVANGTAALHLGALALGVSSASRVITTPITFAASANCVRYCGGNVAFADIDPDTLLIDLEAVRRMLEKAPPGHFQGLIPVDFGGRALRMDAFRRLADQHGLWIMEDACHAVGGHFTDQGGERQRCGNGRFAELTVFSFHPVKHITTGEGGMVTTNSKELYEKLVSLRTHGITKDPARLTQNPGGWYYEMQELGFNYRLSDVQAALGVSQLRRADAGLARRRDIAARYDRAFGGTPVRGFSVPGDEGNAYHLYVVEVADRKRIYDGLRERQIHTQVHYIPVHTMPYYQSTGYEGGPLPHAEGYYARALSLPMYPQLTDEEQQHVIDAILALTTAR